MLIGAASAAGSQPWVSPRYAHEMWTTAEGLPVDAINDLVQGRDGYLWLATFDGLVRFDGVRFTVFTVGTTPGLPSNRFRRIDASRTEGLWLLTVRGDFARFSRDSVLAVAPLTLAPYAQRVGDALWTADPTGVYALDAGVRRLGSSPPGDEVQTLLRDTAGTLWIGTDRGLFRRTDGRWRAVPTGGHETGRILALRDVRQSPGDVWVGAENGLFRVRDGALTAGPGQLRDVSAFFPLPGAELAGYDREGGVFAIRQGRVERVATASTGPPPSLGRALAVDSEGDTLLVAGSRLLHGEEVVFEAGAPISGVLRDHEGNLWVATIGRGLHRLRHTRLTTVGEAEGMTSANAYGLAVGAGGTLWVATLGGWIQRIHDGRVTAYSNGPILTAWTVLEDRRGRLWAGGPGGLWVCRPPAPDDVTSPLPCERTGLELTGDQAVRALHEDRDGTLWVGTMRGTYHLRGDRWSGPLLPNDWIQAFYEDRDGTLWAATYDGVLRIREDRVERLGTDEGLPSRHVRAVYVDAEGVLWVGTEDQGLARVDLRGGGRLADAPVTVYRQRDGLPTDGIHTILDDGAGRFWMSSNQGLFSVHRANLEAVHGGRAQTLSVETYDERDGMRSREANGGVHAAALRTADGRLWFSTQQGVVSLAPTALRRNTTPPPVVVENALVGGQPRTIHDGTLVLRAGESDFDVVYTGLSFAAPERMRFRYRLDGLSGGWAEVDRRTAVFTNVPPGRYTFHVTASNGDGVWSEEGASLRIVVEPQLYETRWFAVLLAVGALAVIGLAVQHRERRARIRARQLETTVAERTRALERETQTVAAQAEELRRLDAFKSRFFANLSHEFRTPLTLIIGPLQRALAGELGPMPPAFEMEGQRMLRNSRRLQRLITQILDLSRLEDGRQPLASAPHDLVPFLGDLTEAFAPLAVETGVALRFAPACSACVAPFDPDLLEKVVLNLLSNAFKATGPGDEVTVSVEVEGARAVVRVADTGPGIPAEEHQRLFDRFYQVDASATRAYEGSGIGLALAKELTELHGGTLHVESEVGAGSTFVLRLPLPDSSPSGAPHEADRPAPTVVERAVEVHEARSDGATEQAEWTLATRTAPDSEDRTTVLVVEDNADMRAFVASVLDGAYRVITAADGPDGLAAARGHLPDLIVSDVMMPGMDGFELNRQLKADPALDSIPVLLLTARAEVDDQVTGYETGADGYLTKPFEAPVLRAQVHALLDTRRRLRERFRDEPQGLAEPAETDTPFVAAVRRGVEARLADPDLTMEDLAAVVHLSYAQFYRRLKEDTGATPVQFVRAVRLERAAALLDEGAGRVSEVAYAVGFNSLSYFSRCFREHFGVTPSAYRAAD